jgi:RHS repeat-associated protein
LGSATARHVNYGYDSFGNNTRETHQNNNGSYAVIDRGFDAYGNIDWEDDPNGNRTDYGYSGGTYLSSKSFEGLTVNYYGYNQWGKPGRIRDENGHSTYYSYDNYGRLTEEDYPGPGEKTIDYYDTARPRYTISKINNGQDTYTYIDGLDRTLQITKRSASSNKITIRRYYDGAGRLYNTAGPFLSSGYRYFTGSIPSNAPYKRITAFDFLNRPRSIRSPDDSSGTVSTDIHYSGFNRTITDPDNKSTTENRDYLGQIQSIRDANDNTADYNYNGAGDLTSVTDAMGNTISMTRNRLGHITLLDDPNLGEWGYTHKPNGEVQTRTDQKSQRITYTYNNRNQLISKVYSTAETGVSLAYNSATNGNGKLYTVNKGNVTTTFNAYDQMGRVTQKTVTIDGKNYVFGYRYDAAGNLTNIAYPDGYSVTLGYHTGTRLLHSVTAAGPDISVYLTAYGNFERPGSIRYPAFTTDINYFRPTGRVDRITVPGLMSLNYEYTDAGDVDSIYDSVRNFSYTYGYDNLHRLTRETAIGPFYRPADRSIDLHYETTEPHAVSRVVADGDERSLIYEDNGNLTIGYDFSTPGRFAERRLQYNTENMPRSIEYQPVGGSTVATRLTYDGDGRRVKKTNGANTVIYVNETYEIRNGRPVKYVFAGNMRLAKIVGSSVHYYHKDHLGSSALVTDSGGNLVDSIVYEPYGRTRQTCQITSGDVAYSYTDQEWDAETGLYNYDARLYDPVLGRFIGADSVVPDWYDPQALDRFAYARNNPLKYIDPDGHFFTPETIWDAANIGIGIASLYSNIKSGSWGSAVVDAVGVALDTGAAVIPIIPGGVSAGIKAGRLADKAVDTARAVDNVADALKASKNILGKAPNPKSVKQFGHTFNTHGAGAKNTNKLKGRAASTGDNQGQWLNNQDAADFLSQHSNMTKPDVVDIPQGMGQVIKPDGSIVPATKAQLVPKPGGGFRSAYPIE